MIGYWHHHVVRLSVCDAVHSGSQGGWVYRAKSCTSVFLAGKLLSLHTPLLCRMYRLITKRTRKTSRRKREPETCEVFCLIHLLGAGLAQTS